MLYLLGMTKRGVSLNPGSEGGLAPEAIGFESLLYHLPASWLEQTAFSFGGCFSPGN